MVDVADMVLKANSSKKALAETLAAVETSDDIKQVLEIVSKDEELAGGLAEAILDASSALEVAGIFAKIAGEFRERQLAGDAQKILESKINTITNTGVNEASIAIAEIKLAFLLAAKAAKARADVQAAYDAAEVSVSNRLGAIE